MEKAAVGEAHDDKTNVDELEDSKRRGQAVLLGYRVLPPGSRFRDRGRASRFGWFRFDHPLWRNSRGGELDAGPVLHELDGGRVELLSSFRLGIADVVGRRSEPFWGLSFSSHQVSCLSC